MPPSPSTSPTILARHHALSLLHHLAPPSSTHAPHALHQLAQLPAWPRPRPPPCRATTSPYSLPNNAPCLVTNSNTTTCLVNTSPRLATPSLPPCLGPDNSPYSLPIPTTARPSPRLATISPGHHVKTIITKTVWNCQQ